MEKAVHPIAAYRAANDNQTQEALGRELGVTGITVSRWETGARKIAPRLVQKVSDKTRIPAQVLRPDLFGTKQ